MIRVPDVSYCQGVIDWEQVYQEYKRGSISAITIRCGYGDNIPEQDDTYWKRNIQAAVRYGIPYAVYLYSYAYNETMARSEAEHVLRLIKGYKPFRVYYDIEEARYGYAAKLIMDVFGKIIKDAGYQPAVCTYESYFNTYLPGYKTYPLWIAKYSTVKPNVGVPYEAWQFSSSETLPGISTRVDMSYFEKALWKETAPKQETSKVTADQILKIFYNWIGDPNAHVDVVETYNAHKPLALGYALSANDAWCDATVSAAFIKANAVDLIGGTECGVERHIQLFKKAGIWMEDGSMVPKKGDIITFNWDDSTQPNDGFADHIGIVETVNGNTITTIEGNNNGAVRRSYYTIGHGNIRGYARPKYGSTQEKAPNKVERPTISYTIKTRNHGVIAATGNGAPLGFANDSILKVKIKVSSGSVQYRCHRLNGKWTKKYKGGTWVGDNTNSLDAIQIYYSTDTAETGGQYYEAVYQVKPYDSSGYLPEVHDTDWEPDDGDMTAGWFGRPFTEIKVKLQKC